MRDPHRPDQEFRDAVHGFVKLSKAELTLIDCPTFQRLRDIRQLAMGHMVYPGATHTRFEHSLGCVHLSDLVFEAIRRRVEREECPNFAQAFRASEDEWKRGLHLLRLAALLHDVGHSPFSHSGERLMPKEDMDGKRRRIKHEDMTARLIRSTEIGEKLDEVFGDRDISREEVIAVATEPALAEPREQFETPWYRFLNGILAGELGSDRMDYILRDAHHSGQEGGRFDYRKLVDSMTIVPPAEEEDDEYRVGLDEGGWLVAEQMVASRYLMYVSLYFHKTKRIYEMHLEEFLGRWLEREYSRPHFPTDDVDQYARLTDSRVLGAMYDAAPERGDGLYELATPFLDRSHLRLAREVVLADNHRVRGSRRVWNQDRFDRLADDVRIKFGDEKVRVDSVVHSALKFLGEKHKIWVSIDGNTRHLGELSEIVRGMPDQIWRGRVYADAERRDDVRSFCNNWLQQNPMKEDGDAPGTPD